MSPAAALKIEDRNWMIIFEKFEDRNCYMCTFNVFDMITSFSPKLDAKMEGLVHVYMGKEPWSCSQSVDDIIVPN